MIHIDNLRKEFDGAVVALDGVSITIEDGSFVALLGPSGCEKTTTLNCLAGLLEPSEGKIFFGGKDVTEAAPRDRNIGMVFQSYALYPHLKVIDNIAFPLKQKKVPKAKRHERAREIARKLKIEPLLARKPAQLSGGQQQRVAMARALVKEPDILLLDEPMSNLDERLKIEIREEIRRIQQEVGVTSVIVTHDQEEAMAIADKIAILDAGKIQQYDTPAALYHSPANLFVANFMGAPPMNFIDATIMQTPQRPKSLGLLPHALMFVGDGFETPVPERLEEILNDFVGEAVVIGVRSHQASIAENKIPHSLEMTLRVVENLGRELILSGDLCGANIRLTHSPSSEDELKHFQALRDAGGSIYFTLNDDINVFRKNDGVNISIPAAPTVTISSQGVDNGPV